MNMIMNFLKDEEGSIMSEYGLLLVLISIFLIAAITVFRDAIAGAFTRAAGVLAGTTTAP
jgi:Flp pilus assembly pilin Flp